jgi:hypothetical protein
MVVNGGPPMSFIPDFPADGIVTLNRVILKPEHTLDELEERVALLCENGNEEPAYAMLWSGKGYSADEAKAARAAKERFVA